MAAPLPLPPQTWLQSLMLEIVRHDAVLTKAKEKVHSLTAAVHRRLLAYPAPRQCTHMTSSESARRRWRSAAGAEATAPIAERRKQVEVERLLLRQAQDHERFLLAQAHDLERLLRTLERDAA